MLRRIYFTSLFLCSLTTAALAQQEPHPCGTTGYSPWLKWYQDNKSEVQERGGADTTWLYVPVTIHIVGTNSGVGYYPQDQAFRIICEMNGQYEAAHILFYLYPGESFVYHNNSSWYEHDWSGGSDLINSTKLPNRVNAYIVSDPAGNCGYSWQDAIVMGKSCSGVGNSTWAHEAGHHLSLPHPFFGWEGFDWNFSTAAPESISGYPVEKTDTSNCYISGDRFCDTRPDYLNYRWSCNNDKESTQLQKDPDGVSFRSDATLIMGYSLDACTSRFTPEQIDAMRMNLMTEHSAYLQETDPGPSIPEDAVVELISPVDSQYAQYNNVVLNWEPVPNATYYTVQIGLSPTFPIYLYNATVYNTSTAVVTKSIPNNRVLYWRVRAYNEWDLCISDNQSSTGVFRTKNLTATNELERLTLVELSPNPVISGIPANLHIVNDAKMDVKVCVRDASGKCFYQEQMRFAPGEFDVDIPTLNLAAGFYILMLENEKGVIIKRMVVVQ